VNRVLQLQAVTVELRGAVSDIDGFYGVKDGTSLLELSVEHSGEVRLHYYIKWLSNDSLAHEEHVNTDEFENKHLIQNVTVYSVSNKFL
jgi:hypothetical protein